VFLQPFSKRIAVPTANQKGIGQKSTGTAILFENGCKNTSKDGL